MRKKLILLRKKHNLTQEHMAELIGVSRTTYTGYENGRVNPSLENGLRIKKILNYTFDDIFLNTNVSKGNKKSDKQF